MSEWISVKDERPVGEDHLLCVYQGMDSYPRMEVGYWNRLTNCWMVNCECQPGLLVTHWMPLPDPPQTDGAA